MIAKQMKKRSGMGLNRVEMKERWLDFERELEERLKLRLNCEEDRQERRIALDDGGAMIKEQRADMDKEELKSPITVLGGLVNNLK